MASAGPPRRRATLKTSIMTRRHFLTAAALAAAAPRAPAAESPALVAITLDLEMSRNFPTWEQTHWDFEKGNLDAAAKRYATGAAKRVKAAGGAIHFFLVGRTLEQESVEWLQQLLAEGHRLGNHTYDHVNVKAARLEQIQHRFQRAPWLVAGQEPAAVIRENIRLCSEAMKSRLGAAPAGFRTPGGFAEGLADAPAVQKMLLDLGFIWCSSKYPRHLVGKPGEEPSAAVLESIVRAQAEAQPFRYASGLLEIPMSPISDIGAFRNARWPLETFLRAIRLALEWTLAHRAVFDFIAHPSCLGIVDPEFRAVDLICQLVRESKTPARLATLDEIAARPIGG